jgi:hypothetical protein
MGNAVKSPIEHDGGLIDFSFSMEQVEQVKAIEQCLNYLRVEAVRFDLPLLARVIDVASTCAREHLDFEERSDDEIIQSSDRQGRQR